MRTLLQILLKSRQVYIPMPRRESERYSSNEKREIEFVPSKSSKRHNTSAGDLGRCRSFLWTRRHMHKMELAFLELSCSCFGIFSYHKVSLFLMTDVDLHLRPSFGVVVSAFPSVGSLAVLPFANEVSFLKGMLVTLVLLGFILIQLFGHLGFPMTGWVYVQPISLFTSARGLGKCKSPSVYGDLHLLLFWGAVGGTNPHSFTGISTFCFFLEAIRGINLQ